MHTKKKMVADLSLYFSNKVIFVILCFRLLKSINRTLGSHLRERLEKQVGLLRVAAMNLYPLLPPLLLLVSSRRPKISRVFSHFSLPLFSLWMQGP